MASKRYFYPYISDDGETYEVATTKENGDAQGATPESQGTNPVYPRGWVMRRVYGKTADGESTHIPIFDPTDAHFTGGSTSISKGGVSYRIAGKRGEHRYTRGAEAVPEQ